MKKTGIIIILTLMSLMAYSQSNFYIGLNTGPFFKPNSNISNLGSGVNLNTKVDFNYGLSAGYAFTSNNRVRIEAKYVKIQYEQVYSYIAADPNDPLIPERSELDIYGLAINLIYDYKLFAAGKFSIFISPGFKTQFALSYHEKTIYPYGGVSSDFIEGQYKKALYGLGIGFIGKYNITERIGIILIPDGSYYFKKFFDDEEKNFKSMNINLGFEIKL